jgi:DNA-binding CsgD family transcriptional regulator
MGLAEGSLGHVDQGLDLVRSAAKGDSHEQQPGLRAWAQCHEATLLRRAGRVEDARLAAEQVVSLARALDDAYASLNFEANLLFTRGLLGDDPAERLDAVAERAIGLRLAFVALKSRLYSAVLAGARRRTAVAERLLADCIPRQLELGHLHVVAQELCPRPDIALAALAVAGRSGLTQQLMDALSIHHGFADLAEAVCAEHPASAHLAVDAARRHSPDAVLARVVRAAERSGSGEAAAAAARARATRPQPPGGARDRLDRLTPRELEILGLMAEGLRNPDLVARLFLSESTVKTHVNHIFTKLAVRTRVEAVLLFRDAPS